jgi:hypothetical protein
MDKQKTGCSYEQPVLFEITISYASAVASPAGFSGRGNNTLCANFHFISMN